MILIAKIPQNELLFNDHSSYNHMKIVNMHVHYFSFYSSNKNFNFTELMRGS